MTDIETTIKGCEAAATRTDLPKEVRTLLSIAAHRLEQSRSQMALAVVELQKAAKLRAGFTASDSMHQEVARLKNRAMEEQAGFLQALLNSKAPSQEPRKEVI